MATVAFLRRASSPVTAGVTTALIPAARFLSQSGQLRLMSPAFLHLKQRRSWVPPHPRSLVAASAAAGTSLRVLASSRVSDSSARSSYRASATLIPRWDSKLLAKPSSSDVRCWRSATSTRSTPSYHTISLLRLK